LKLTVEDGFDDERAIFGGFNAGMATDLGCERMWPVIGVYGIDGLSDIVSDGS
jgi:hypothetical protein